MTNSRYRTEQDDVFVSKITQDDTQDDSAFTNIFMVFKTKMTRLHYLFCRSTREREESFLSLCQRRNAFTSLYGVYATKNKTSSCHLAPYHHEYIENIAVILTVILVFKITFFLRRLP